MSDTPTFRGNLDVLKKALRKATPGVKNSHRIEAMARGLGFNTYAALLAHIRVTEEWFPDRPISLQGHDAPFNLFLKTKHYPLPSDTVLTDTLKAISK